MRKSQLLPLLLLLSSSPVFSAIYSCADIPPGRNTLETNNSEINAFYVINCSDQTLTYSYQYNPASFNSEQLHGLAKEMIKNMHSDKAILNKQYPFVNFLSFKIYHGSTLLDSVIEKIK
ncbi:hypothetical protein C9J41_04405 [Photobacterium sp. GB-50]|uniref:hypothetical protein n=1 Tax=Photobacterium sp. GB-50 TaxID=2022107 RepID=UPI000D1686EC|nr:hypothetical protein [Photobacterium sp. GB-50]PSW74937.1 hypothetical protein C9J41_04405 [Photobacterium sp. GB-50]